MTYGHSYQGSWGGPTNQQSSYGNYGGGSTNGQQAPNTGYSPVSFDDSSSFGESPEAFYGLLIDRSTNRPSDVLCRLVDALFFYLDSNCDVPGLKGTQHIEPAKFGWLHKTLGATPDDIDKAEMASGDLWAKASIPHRIVNVNGQMTPILDRRGFLHLAVFAIRASPSETHQHWSQVLATHRLVDPQTQTPFPTPLPRSAFPAVQDHQLYLIFMTWNITASGTVARVRTSAMFPQYTAAAALGGAGLGAGAYGVNAYGANAYGGGGAADISQILAQSQANSQAMMAQALSGMNANSGAASGLAGMGGAGGVGGAGPTYANAAANVFSTLMGGGMGGFTGFGM